MTARTAPLTALLLLLTAGVAEAQWQQPSPYLQPAPQMPSSGGFGSAPSTGFPIQGYNGNLPAQPQVPVYTPPPTIYQPPPLFVQPAPVQPLYVPAPRRGW